MSKYPKMRISIAILFLLAVQLATAQLSGHGVIDGVYQFEVNTFAAGDDVMEGQITYADIAAPGIAFSLRKGDTIHIQEIDEYFNSVMQMILVKRADQFEGYYFNTAENIQLPVQFHLMQTPLTTTYAFQRYESNNTNHSQVFDMPLSPTNRIGKYIDADNKVVTPFYTMADGAEERIIFTDESTVSLQKGETVESIPAQSFYYTDGKRSIEAIIPSFNEIFVDSLQSSLVRWKAAIEKHEPIENSGRFPTRYYAICDVDFWSEQYISGSFEYIGPDGSGEGYTFLFDRKSNKFMSMDVIAKNGSFAELYPTTKGLGLSFDRYGVIEKGAFHPAHGRQSVHHPWKEAAIKIKKKINQLIR